MPVTMAATFARNDVKSCTAADASLRLILVPVCLLGLMVLCSPAAKAVTIFDMQNGESCGAWTSEHRVHSVKAAQLESWLFGFLSGWAETLASAPDSVAVTTRDPLAAFDTAGAIEWINGYCAQHSIDQLAEAAKRLEEAIIQRQKSAK